MTDKALAEALEKLAERVENAEAGEQRKLLLRAYEAAYPNGVLGERVSKFFALLDAGGFLDAAMSLIPPAYDDLPEHPAWSLDATGMNFVNAVVWRNRECFVGRAHSGALAVTAASLRALASQHLHKGAK